MGCEPRCLLVAGTSTSLLLLQSTHKASLPWSPLGALESSLVHYVQAAGTFFLLVFIPSAYIAILTAVFRVLNSGVS